MLTLLEIWVLYCLFLLFNKFGALAITQFSINALQYCRRDYFTVFTKIQCDISVSNLKFHL